MSNNPFEKAVVKKNDEEIVVNNEDKDRASIEKAKADDISAMINVKKRLVCFSMLYLAVSPIVGVIVFVVYMVLLVWHMATPPSSVMIAFISATLGGSAFGLFAIIFKGLFKKI